MSFRAKRTRPSRRWPFGLLLAAWFCANCPQTAIFTVLTWMSEARSFTHQQRLTLDVAHLLGGEKATRPIAQAVARAQEKIPAKPLPPIPAEVLFKKIQLSLETAVGLLPIALRADRHENVVWSCPEPRRCAPPHGPPRMSLA